MQIGAPGIVIIGLANGNFAGWDLNTNQVNYLQAHAGIESGVVYLQKFESLMLSGDRAGRVQVRSTANYQLVLPETQVIQKAPISQVYVLRKNGEDWMLIADAKGFITAVKADPSNQLMAVFGAFNDRTSNPKISHIFVGDQGQSLYVLGDCGILRKWTLT